MARLLVMATATMLRLEQGLAIATRQPWKHEGSRRVHRGKQGYFCAVDTYSHIGSATEGERVRVSRVLIRPKLQRRTALRISFMEQMGVSQDGELAGFQDKYGCGGGPLPPFCRLAEEGWQGHPGRYGACGN